MKFYKFSIFLFFAFFLTRFSLNAQIHTIKEILTIMEESPVRYSIGDLNKTIPEPDRSNLIIPHNRYRIINGNSIDVGIYEYTDEIQQILDDAEKMFEISDMVGARNLYKQILEKKPDAYNMLVYIGDTYYQEQNLSEAQKYYQEAIQKNYVDYLAHWAYANTCLYLKDFKTALKEITIAKILNRNNPNLHKKFMEIYSLNKVNYTDWKFIPQYELEYSYDQANEKDIVTIKSDGFWTPFAICKGVWEYEPGYADANAKNEFEFLYKQEYESMAALLKYTYKTKDSKSNIELKVLSSAYLKGMFEYYVVYESILPNVPLFSYFLPKETIEGIADYVIYVRSKIKK